MTEQAAAPRRLPLHRGQIRPRVVIVVAMLFGALVGVLVALVVDGTAGLVAGVLAALALLSLLWASARREVWLEGTHVVARTIGRRTVDLSSLAQADVLVTEFRGMRSVGLLLGGRRAVNLPLAAYTSAGARELGILELRRLADALARSSSSRARVLAQLLVAQLRSEARGDGLADRPLYRVVSMAPPGRLGHRLSHDTVTRFVAGLD